MSHTQRLQSMASRIRLEFTNLERLVPQIETAARLAGQDEDYRPFFIASAAFDLQDFYTAIERLLKTIAAQFDAPLPTGEPGEFELLYQMKADQPGDRPAVLSVESYEALLEYQLFRTVARRVYSFELRAERVIELADTVRKTYTLASQDLLKFADYLDAQFGGSAAEAGG